MDDEYLVEKFGSWVRVQVAFYDYIFIIASEMCTHHTNEAMMEAFMSGGDPYEDMVKAINEKFDTFGEAWKAFVNEQGG